MKSQSLTSSRESIKTILERIKWKHTWQRIFLFIFVLFKSYPGHYNTKERNVLKNGNIKKDKEFSKQKTTYLNAIIQYIFKINYKLDKLKDNEINMFIVKTCLNEDKDIQRNNIIFCNCAMNFAESRKLILFLIKLLVCPKYISLGISFFKYNSRFMFTKTF